MTIALHPTAVVDPDADLAADAVVGPYAVIGPGVVVGAGSEIQAHAVLERDVWLGRHCLVGYGSVLGSAPQDLQDAGVGTRVEIGDETRLREYVTVHRGTLASQATRIGARCYLMSYVHVAHDCVIGDDAVLANAVQLAGHVQVGRQAWIGGQTPIHQFVRIGEHAFVGGGSRVPQDVPPYARVAGVPLRLYGVNVLGLRRAGIAPDVRLALQRAFRLLFNSDLTTSAALERLRAEPDRPREVDRLLEFIAASPRGVLRG
ncbi:MAG: acyl-ACP--UDP-N-acetylglucosamine O-acyltransferase [Gemmatimonadota bacterium]|nr:acyl-ACP--UDP-N-acetylglucosamine O-acyltransferase [Gemmatimonadota bacterium]